MKGLLKAIPVIYSVNSLIKDFALSFETARIKRSYKSRIENLPQSLIDGNIGLMLHKRTSQHVLMPTSDLSAPLHIYIVGTYYDHEAYGFLQAFQRVGRVSTYVGMDGKYGINSSARGDGSPAGYADNIYLLEQIRLLHAEHRIDFVIGTFLASTISVDTLIAIRSLGIPIINIAMDDRLPANWRISQGVKMGAIGLAEGVDLTLQTTKEFVPRYIAEGCPCIYWPFASDPQIFKPAQHKNIDVAFVGNNYGKRNALVKAIQSAGIHVECYGYGFPNGHVPGNSVADIFSRAKIILGTGLVGHSSTIVTLKLRDFDAPMAGALYITNYNPDLVEMFDLEREMVTYTSTHDCIEKIKHYLGNDVERETIASAGRVRASREHTWDMRVQVLLQLMGLK